MKWLLAFVGVVVGTVAVLMFIGGPEASLRTNAEAAVSRNLLDPSSARFSEVRIVAGPGGTSLVCGMVNAKNKFGGYVGAQPLCTTTGWIWPAHGPTMKARSCAVLCGRRSARASPSSVSPLTSERPTVGTRDTARTRRR